MVSKMVSQGQKKNGEANSYNLPQTELFVAGRLGEESYKSVMDMIEAYKQGERGKTEKVDAAKRSVMILPGISKAFLTME